MCYIINLKRDNKIYLNFKVVNLRHVNDYFSVSEKKNAIFIKKYITYSLIAKIKDVIIIKDDKVAKKYKIKDEINDN